ncbi:MAG TPA: NAD(P)-dependent oxidoreductase [Jatrophihabitantaceae bacterium]|jgi:nucleoside-diphosphate-sugar epimerase|nr:NAD(P)-dependent oxidoreductase [Jatrophihabitantaceae bacterium]
MPEQRSVAITGANGYVGSTLARAFSAAGWRVHPLQRSGPRDARYEFIPYSLADGPARTLPANLSALVHCAYDLRARDASSIERTNVGGTAKLLAAASDVPNVVLISSMSAYAGTSQLYGRTKLACEELVTARGGTSLRLGLVHGGAKGGMIGALQRVAKLPVVPVLKPDSHQFTVHADDMARCVLAAAGQLPIEHRVLGVAHPRAVPFTEIIASLHGTEPVRTVAIASKLLYRGLRVGEAVGVRTGFRADSLLGLMHPAPDVPNVAYWAGQGITLRDFAEAVSEE